MVVEYGPQVSVEVTVAMTVDTVVAVVAWRRRLLAYFIIVRSDVDGLTGDCRHTWREDGGEGKVRASIRHGQGRSDRAEPGHAICHGGR